MGIKLQNMAMVKHAERLDDQGKGLQSLIRGILAQEKENIGGLNPKDYYHHPYNIDPATHGPPFGVKVDIYYVPASINEKLKNEVIGGQFSARQRLAVRTSRDGALGFYRTSHPVVDRRLNKNEYSAFTPINVTQARSLSEPPLQIKDKPQLRERRTSGFGVPSRGENGLEERDRSRSRGRGG